MGQANRPRVGDLAPLHLLIAGASVGCRRPAGNTMALSRTIARCAPRVAPTAAAGYDEGTVAALA